MFLVLSYVYSKQPIFGLTQEWLRELFFSRLQCGVHDIIFQRKDVLDRESERERERMREREREGERDV